jgi:hypothetical protein
MLYQLTYLTTFNSLISATFMTRVLDAIPLGLGYKMNRNSLVLPKKYVVSED